MFEYPQYVCPVHIAVLHKNYILLDMLQTELTYVESTFHLLRCISAVSVPGLISKCAVSSARHG